MDTYRQASQVLKVMGHPVRLRILNALRHDEECVCHLTALLHKRQAYVSQQLMFLREVGLIEDRKDGLRVYYRIRDAHVIAVLDAMNALVGIEASAAERKTLPACPCPKCDGSGVREQGAKPRTFNSLVRPVPKA